MSLGEAVACTISLQLCREEAVVCEILSCAARPVPSFATLTMLCLQGHAPPSLLAHGLPQARLAQPQCAATHSNAPPCCCPASAGAELVIAPGFEVPLFVASAAFGAGRLYVNGMRAQNVTLQMSG